MSRSLTVSFQRLTISPSISRALAKGRSGEPSGRRYRVQVASSPKWRSAITKAVMWNNPDRRLTGATRCNWMG